MTVTVTAPVACAVVVQVIEVAETAETVQPEPPKSTVAPVRKSEPFTVTTVPPDIGPFEGATEVTVGAS